MKKLTVAQRKTCIQFLKFCIVGGCGFLFDCALVHIGIYVLGLQPVAAGFASFPFSATFTWAGNRFFTYRDVKHKSFGKQLVKFMVVCSIGLFFNRGTYTLVVTQVPVSYAHPFGLPLLDLPTLGLMAGTGVALFFNFFAAKKLVFR